MRSTDTVTLLAECRGLAGNLFEAFTATAAAYHLDAPAWDTIEPHNVESILNQISVKSHLVRSAELPPPEKDHHPKVTELLYEGAEAALRLAQVFSEAVEANRLGETHKIKPEGLKRIIEITNMLSVQVGSQKNYF